MSPRVAIFIGVLFLSNTFAKSEQLPTKAQETRKITFKEFRDFVVDVWRPKPGTEDVFREFLQEQHNIVRSLISISNEWELREAHALNRQNLGEVRCIRQHIPALRSASVLAESLNHQFQEMSFETKVTSKRFDQLSEVALLSQNLDLIQQSIEQCLFRLRLDTFSNSTHRGLYRLGAVGRKSHVQIPSLSPFPPGRFPFR